MGLAQGFGLARGGLRVAEAVEVLHQLFPALVGHRPEARHHGLRALPLREHGEALDLLAVGRRPARRGVAGRERQQFDAAEQVDRAPDLGEREAAAVTEEQERVALVAGLDGEVARDVDDLKRS